MQQRCGRADGSGAYCIAAYHILTVVERNTLAELLDGALGRGIRSEARLCNVAADAAHIHNAAAALLHMRHGSLDAKGIPHNVGVEHPSPICA